jgi:hypothetical protein
MKRMMRNARLLWRAETMLGAQRVAALAQRSSVMALSALMAAFGVAMLNLAAFLAFAPEWGDVRAAFAIAGADFLIAIGLIVLLRVWPTGAHVAAIVQVRDLALEELESDVARIEGVLANKGAELRHFVSHPIGSLAPGALLALTKSILTTLRTPRRE